jgi:hypothetical protein
MQQGRTEHKSLYGKRLKAEDVCSIDVRRWARDGLLQPFASGVWGWRIGMDSEIVNQIQYACDGSAVTLQFVYGGRIACQLVPLNASGCNLGGARWWFSCPVCSARIALLFLRSGRFACRRCNSISYQSQSEDWIGRMGLRQGRIEDHSRGWRPTEECPSTPDMGSWLHPKPPTEICRSRATSRIRRRPGGGSSISTFQRGTGKGTALRMTLFWVNCYTVAPPGYTPCNLQPTRRRRTCFHGPCWKPWLEPSGGNSASEPPEGVQGWYPKRWYPGWYPPLHGPPRGWCLDTGCPGTAA